MSQLNIEELLIVMTQRKQNLSSTANRQTL